MRGKRDYELIKYASLQLPRPRRFDGENPYHQEKFASEGIIVLIIPDECPGYNLVIGVYIVLFIRWRIVPRNFVCREILAKIDLVPPRGIFLS